MSKTLFITDSDIATLEQLADMLLENNLITTESPLFQSYRGLQTRMMQALKGEEELYQVKPEDLVGDIKDFPMEVVQKMVERQFGQTGKCDVRVFQEDKSAPAEIGGFTWDNSMEGWAFWARIINGLNFDLFFEKYPKQ